MKKMLVLLTTLALTVAAASAQTTSTPTPAAQNSYPGGRGQGHGRLTPELRAQRMTERLTRELALSTEQATRVQGILLAQSQENEAIRTKYATSTDRRAALPELKAAKEKYDTQLKAVLTSEQHIKYAQLRDEQQQQRREKMKAGKTKSKTQS
ncbi:hypothetical protein FY528_14665 [Hymenobacter lutimineralis]|uniref:Periplasmic heavy metal sensor n=1 Tax=Hymenobacter lutimineralis TaxID=2606448 RepID=A0A5D6UV38_9BACT|nr:hypothetical protein [Hymenobacter lutimineralis]TYZ07601.1 hypothetical protein FY528_14665 [Hymenobacter lutimineralis]